mmetsp:Transcript_8154/g.23941  ORF Transcript_8154/g.23941 Transcript_8154/m.23941 type:complete len:538 (+) Transcript_8154:69-1682(+)
MARLLPCCLVSFGLWALVTPSTGAAVSLNTTDDFVSMALGMDEECQPGAPGGCALSALQLHGRRTRPQSQGQSVAASEMSRGGNASLAREGPWLPTPPGVNLGGWLCLEDWFFSGTSGRDVSTNDHRGQGRCFPPLVPSIRWSSEGLLTKQLVDHGGYKATIKAFEAHRRTYIGEDDLRKMAALGIKTVRLPLTWAAFADALKPLSHEAYGRHDPERQMWVVPDPFYTRSTAWVTIPRVHLAEFARMCRRHGLRVLFDLHAFPGGSSDATYSGVWPQRPAFWTEKARIGGGKVPLWMTGLWIAKALVQWVEHLDREALEGVAGVSLMNEPAHLAAKASRPWAYEFQIPKWLETSAHFFRGSRLPRMGKRLYIQVVPTAFKDFLAVVPGWYARAFSPQERHSWAVIDVHWYAAWDAGRCDGRTSPGGGYHCGQPVDHVRGIMHGCVERFAGGFLSHFDGNKACSEMSVGTYEHAQCACRDGGLLHAFLEEQVKTMGHFGIEPFFWTWRMPFGQAFEPGWSLKHLAGMENPPPGSLCRA